MIPDQRIQIVFLLSVLFAFILMCLVSLWAHKTFHIPFQNQDSGNVIIFLPI